MREVVRLRWKFHMKFFFSKQLEAWSFVWLNWVERCHAICATIVVRSWLDNHESFQMMEILRIHRRKKNELEILRKLVRYSRQWVVVPRSCLKSYMMIAHQGGVVWGRRQTCRTFMSNMRLIGWYCLPFVKHATFVINGKRGWIERSGIWIMSSFRSDFFHLTVNFFRHFG